MINLKDINVLLMGGNKGSGKTTIANKIVELMKSGSLKVKVLSYAHPFKSMLYNGGILTKEQAWGSDDEKNTPTNVLASHMPDEIWYKYRWPEGHKLTGREVMQIFGNDFCKLFSPEIWVNTMVNEIKNDTNKDLYIIDDYRFHGLESNLPFNVHSVYLSTNVANRDVHLSENSLSAKDCDLELITDKANPDNLRNNVNTLRAAIQRWYHI